MNENDDKSLLKFHKNRERKEGVEKREREKEDGSGEDCTVQ